MFKKTAVALVLAMVAGAGFAGQGSMGMNAGNSTSTNAVGHSTGADTDRALGTQFRALDSNGDGAISRSEAASNPQLARMYDSLDTSATIEDRAKQSTPSGLTFDQFKAGMQANASGSGALGPSVSGGETYILMKDGSKRLKSGSSRMNSGTGQGMSNMNRSNMNGAASGMQHDGQSMQHQGQPVGGGAMDDAGTMGNDAYQRERNSRMQGDAAARSNGSMGNGSVDVQGKTGVKSNY